MLIVSKLFLVHASHFALVGFLIHLAAQEILVVPIDASDLSVETLLLKLVVLFVRLPDHSLLIVESLLGLLASLLLCHLSGQQVAHLLLLLALTLHATLILQASPHLLFLFKAHQGLLFLTDAGLLLGNDIACKGVHEVLSAGLARTELTQAVSLLLVKHLAILVLSLNISLDLSLAIIVRFHLIRLILAQHLLQVFFFLTAFLLLKLALHFHFLLKSIDQVDLLAERILVLVSLAILLLS